RVWGKAIDGATNEERERNIEQRGKIPRGQYQPLKNSRGAGKRFVPLAQPAIDLLNIIRAKSKYTAPDDAVFCGEKSGAPINAANVLRRQVKPVLANLSLPNIDWHGLRHSQTTIADEAGMPTGQRQRILGHASEAMTSHYTHANFEASRPG